MVIRYLRRAAGCAVPTDDVAVSETLSGIRRQAARQRETQRKKVAATAGILHQILAPIPSDLRGLRLTLHQTKGLQTPAVIVPLPYGRTELCPVRAITAWLEGAGIV